MTPEEYRLAIRESLNRAQPGLLPMLDALRDRFNAKLTRARVLQDGKWVDPRTLIQHGDGK